MIDIDTANRWLHSVVVRRVEICLGRVKAAWLGSNPDQCTVEVSCSALLMRPREVEISIYRDKYFSAFFEIQFIFKNTEQFQGLP